MQNATVLVSKLQAEHAPPGTFWDYWVVTHDQARVLAEHGHTIHYGAGLPIWCRHKSEGHESKADVCRKLGLAD